MSIEGVHFTSDLHPPEAVGHRALARSLSDIAAMGGTPRYALISLAVSLDRASLVGRLLQRTFCPRPAISVAVIGGDTAVVNGPVAVDVVVAGEVPHGRALLRSGAELGPDFRQRTPGHGRAGTAFAAVARRVSETRGAGRPARSSFSSAPMRSGPIPFRAPVGQRDDGPERWPFHRSPAALRRQRRRSNFVRRSNPHAPHRRCRGRLASGASRWRGLPIALHRRPRPRPQKSLAALAESPFTASEKFAPREAST